LCSEQLSYQLLHPKRTGTSTALLQKPKNLQGYCVFMSCWLSFFRSWSREYCATTAEWHHSGLSKTKAATSDITEATIRSAI